MPGGGDGQQTTIQNNEPWKPAIPYYLGDPKRNIPGVLPEAMAWYRSTVPQWYPGQSVAGLAPEEEAGMQALVQRGLAGNPLMAAAGQYAQNAIGGQYLGAGNPHAAAIGDAVRAQVQPGIDSMFASAGRYGSGAHAGQVSQGVANALAPQLFQNYQYERGLQENAAQLAPQFAAADYQDVNALLQAGQLRRTYAQSLIDADKARWDFEQNMPLQKLNAYASLVGGAPGAHISTSAPRVGPSPVDYINAVGGLIGEFLPYLP
jgi:hypothetical protein